MLLQAAAGEEASDPLGSIHVVRAPCSSKADMTPQDQWLLQKERILAWLRVGFALVAVAVIQFNPSRVARFPLLSYISLGCFLIYSAAILYVVLKQKTDSKT